MPYAAFAAAVIIFADITLIFSPPFAAMIAAAAADMLALLTDATMPLLLL